jgi:transposase
VFRFVADAAIPPTQHASDQAIRMSTVLRQGTHGLRSNWGRALFAAVRSVVTTGTRHGLSAFQAIQKARAPMDALFDPG